MDDLERFLRSLFHIGVMAVAREIGMGAQKALSESLDKRDWAGIFGNSFVYGGSVVAFQSSGRKLNRLLGNSRAPLPSFYDSYDNVKKDKTRYLLR